MVIQLSDQSADGKNGRRWNAAPIWFTVTQPSTPHVVSVRWNVPA